MEILNSFIGLIGVSIGFIASYGIEIYRNNNKKEESKRERNYLFYKECFEDSKHLLTNFIVESMETEKELHILARDIRNGKKVVAKDVNQRYLNSMRYLREVQIMIEDRGVVNAACDYGLLLINMYQSVSEGKPDDTNGDEIGKSFSDLQFKVRKHLIYLRKRSYGISDEETDLNN